MFTISMVLFSCASCRKLFEKKTENDNKERVNIPEIKIDIGDDKIENGIMNPGYQEGETTAETKAEISTNQQVNEVKDVSKPSEAENDITVKENETTMNDHGLNAAVADGIQLTEKDDEITELDVQQLAEKLQDRKQDAGITNTAFEKTKETEIKANDEPDIENNTEPTINAPDPDVQKSDFLNQETDEDAKDLNDAETQNSVVTVDDSSNEQDMTRYENIVFQSEWRQPVALSDLIETGLISRDIANEVVKEMEENKALKQDETDVDEVPTKIAKFLRGDEPVAGIVVSDTGEKKSIFKSAKDGILRRGTAISLLEAQAATGNIIDPVTGRKMSVKEAAQLGLLDKVYETVLLRAERAVTGYKFRVSDHVLSVYEAMKKELVVKSHGLRLLEAQNATGGIIDHRINVRLPLDVALKRGLLDDELKGILEDEDGDETKTFFDPNTEQNVTYSELMRRSVVDNDTGLRLYPLERMTKKRVNYGSYSGRSSLASSKNASTSNSKENIPAAIAAT